MKINVENNEILNNVVLFPVNIYETKVTIKQKICSIIKRLLDIIIGIIGIFFLIPITIRNIYIKNNHKR